MSPYNTKSLPPLEQLQAVLKYQPTTGNLIWLQDRAKRKVKAGEVAGCIGNSGYRIVSVNNETYRAHRLAYYLYHGKDVEPGKVIDHKNGDRDDNRIKNLQEITQSENLRKAEGIKGYDYHKGKQMWRARISIEGKQKFLGYFNTEEEARAAYVAVKKFCGLD